jgi:hypothetical protein
MAAITAMAATATIITTTTTAAMAATQATAITPPTANTAATPSATIANEYRAHSTYFFTKAANAAGSGLGSYVGYGGHHYYGHSIR